MNIEENELDLSDFCLALGINNASNLNHGVRSGLSVSPSASQQKAIEKLASKISLKSDKAEEEVASFDILSKPRIILHESKVLKKSMNSIVQHSSKRYLILLNDIILVCAKSENGFGSKMGLTSEKIVIHQVFSLDSIYITDLQSESNVCEFEITTEERSYQFLSESESEKNIWLSELESAILSIPSTHQNAVLPGWKHEKIRGTIFSAAYFGDLASLSFHLSRSADPPMTADENGMNPLHLAAFNGQLEAVRILLDRGVEIDALNNGLNSALHLASANGHFEVVNLLVERGADTAIRNLKDRDALFMAVLYSSRSQNLMEVVHTLVSRGVAVNQTDASGSMPLHECASRNLSTPIQILVDMGAAINARHARNGLTPLLLACSSEKPDAETVRVFLEKGAHPNWKSSIGKSPFDLVLASYMRQQSLLGPESAQIDHFVQHVLPVLLEIAKKGGRFDIESISFLRPSFQDALLNAANHWPNLRAPDLSELIQHVGEGAVICPPQKWCLDSAFKNCQLCLEKFTMSMRKHHCRSCGVLCCSLCSTKKLLLRPSLVSPPSSTKSASSPSKAGSADQSSKHEERVCDGCFNRLSSTCIVFQQKLRKMETESSEIDCVKASSEKAQLLSSSTPNTSTKLDSTTSAMSEAMENMQLRGQKLEELAEKSERMKEAATDFNQQSRALLRQQQMKNKSYW